MDKRERILANGPLEFRDYFDPGITPWTFTGTKLDETTIDPDFPGGRPYTQFSKLAELAERRISAWNLPI